MFPWKNKLVLWPCSVVMWVYQRLSYRLLLAINQLPVPSWKHIQLWKVTILNEKTHYFHGHAPHVSLYPIKFHENIIVLWFSYGFPMVFLCWFTRMATAIHARRHMATSPGHRARWQFLTLWQAVHQESVLTLWKKTMKTSGKSSWLVVYLPLWQYMGNIWVIYIYI